jgi:hypothetical protein
MPNAAGKFYGGWRAPRRTSGTKSSLERFIPLLAEEETMPVLLLWAIPAVVVIGGGAYWITHLH